MVEPFPLTLRERDFEPCHAAAARLAARWGASDSIVFARELGHPFPDLLRGTAVPEFATRAGLDRGSVLADTPVVAAASRTVVLRGQQLRLGDWSMRSRRRCPLCVDEDRSEAIRMGIPPEWWATNRFWWDVRSIDACPRHAVALTDRCAACGALQTWRRGLLACRCGAEHVPGSAVDADPSVSRYMLSRMGCAAPLRVPVLDRMELVDAVRTMEMLGAARLDRQVVKPRRAEADLPYDRAHGLSLAADWPVRFRSLLDGLVAGRDAFAADGLLSTYGWLYSEVCVGDAPRVLADLVAPVLREHAVANGVIARDEPRLGATVPETVTATDVARRIGRSYSVTRRLLEERRAIPAGSRRGVGFAIDPIVLDGLGRGDRASPSKRLRVGRTQARTLLRDGGLACVLRLEDPSADDLLAAIGARATVGSAHGLVPLSAACRNMSVALTSACIGILDGRVRVKWCGTLDDGFGAVLVRQSDLAALRETDGLLSVEDVARLGGIHHETARHLVRTGVIGDGRGGRVTREAAARFFAEHVTAAEIARTRGTSSARLSKTLLSLGVLPRFAPPTCRQVIFARSDLPVLH